MGVGRRWVLSAVGVLLATTMPATATATATATSAPTIADPSRLETGRVGVIEAPAPQVSARAMRRYWTPARMAAAVPLDLVDIGDAVVRAPSHRLRPGRERTAPGRVPVPRTTGKLFFSDGPFDFVCSAAAIRTRRRNQVITAGHCVHTGPDVGFLEQPHFYQNWLFVPRYHRGKAPLGRWSADRAYVFEGWAQEGATRFDQAILAFDRRNGRRLVDVVGGNEVVPDKPARRWGVRIWGWPAESPYDGETARRCEGRTVRDDRYSDSGGDAVMRGCNLNGGASGGPWFLPRGQRANVGRIFAVTSRRDVNRPILIAHPIPRGIGRMIRNANR